MSTMRRSSIHASVRLLTTGLAALAVLAAASRADAATAFGLTVSKKIVTFDTNAPGIALSVASITGMEPGEVALAIDLRPATGQMYLLGNSNRLYVVNPATGVATAVGGPFTPALSGTAFGFDFNPTVDRIRVVSDTGQNMRLNPDTGAVAGVDTSLNRAAPGTPHIVEVAYANNYAGAATTTLYAIDPVTDQLYIQNPPNGGVLVPVGPLGTNLFDVGNVGFDISANDNRAFAIVKIGAADGLITIDLATGLETPVGAMPNGPFCGLTVLSRAVPMVGLRGNELIRFHSATPGTIQGTATISGLAVGEQLVGIDVRPADGQLYGVSTASRLYLLNAISGVATPIGAPFSTPLSGTRFGVDFNPTADRLRVVSDAEQNLRINPNNASIAGVDVPLTPAGTITGIAYSNNVDGAGTTTLYDIDATSNQLFIQSFPNSGTLTAVGPLGVDTSFDIAFDISPLANTGFAALTVGGVSGLYTIDLATGAATSIGTIGTGTIISGLAAMPLVYQFAEGATGTFFDTDLLLANPTTSQQQVTITYLTETARVVTQSVLLGPQSRVTVSADANAQLGDTAFSSTVTSPLGVPIAVERTMRWDATGYGMHTEKAATALARDWFFAEGSQGFYDTFFLLTNPSAVANVANVRFFLENGTQVTHSYNLNAQSRLTIFAGSIPELVNQSFGAQVTFTFAGAAERAMYFGTPVFSGGHESAGVTRPSTNWYLAEGATGSFFTTFVLLSNPNATPAAVTLTYLLEGGGTVTRLRTIPAGTRLTINIAIEDPSLAATSAATRVTSDVPIVVERSMYWPITPASWNEASNAFGVTETARRWGLAEGRVGGPNAFQTYILVANPDVVAATITLTVLRTTGAPIVKTFTVPAGARLTITTGPGTMVPELADESFGATIVSSSPIFVERALYSNANGVFWAAGSAATATPLP
jgi:hypothetical protein